MRVLMKADPSCRESLQTEADVDPMDAEQTWPTETELLEAEGTKESLFGVQHLVFELHSPLPLMVL